MFNNLLLLLLYIHNFPLHFLFRLVIANELVLFINDNLMHYCLYNNCINICIISRYFILFYYFIQQQIPLYQKRRLLLTYSDTDEY